MPTDSRPATEHQPSAGPASGTAVIGEVDEPTADEVGTLAAPAMPTPLDIDALREIAEIVREHDEDFSAEFFARLFVLEPETRALFPVAMRPQYSRFTAALRGILESIDDPDVLVPFVK